MANRPDHRMSIADRAKQFSSFDALSGLEAALEKKRRELGFVEKAVLSEDAEEALNEKLISLRKGQIISVRHYSSGEYALTTGLVTAVDKLELFIKIDDEKIFFDDIDDILYE